MRYLSHLLSAKHIIEAYEGKEPFSHFIKHIFRQNKKYGSKDRKDISQLCYGYFRLGHGMPGSQLEEKILMGLFLCSSSPHPLLEHFQPAWNEHIKMPVEKKIAFLSPLFSVTDIFPWLDALSDGIDPLPFCQSFLVQPDLFLRVRPGYKMAVTEKLSRAGIPFYEREEACIGLDNATPIEGVLDLDKEAVVQDLNSQRAANLFPLPMEAPLGRPYAVWDCCAASGGKSIMVCDRLGKIDLTVSDIRASILHNLQKRLESAGIQKYQSFVADLSIPSSQGNRKKNKKYDLIIADLPCSGSGTWSRSPEAIGNFRQEQIEKFSSLQKKILATVAPCLEQDGVLVYITCSVFKMENESMVEYIQQKFGFQLLKMALLAGYQAKADTLFAASFKAG